MFKMKNVFPALILISMAGVLVFAGTSEHTLWALIPAVATVSIGIIVFIVFLISDKRTKTKTA